MTLQMYYYILFDRMTDRPPGQWEEVEAPIPVFTVDSEVVITPTLSRFEVDAEVLPFLTYLPQRQYLFATPIPGVRAFLEEEVVLFFEIDDLTMEPALLRWLGAWNTA